MPAGRFAPSPSGDLHLGNLRTALLAWLFARSSDRRFVMRVEDLDRVKTGSEQRQLDDLAAIGIDWDGPVMRQSERREIYDATIRTLTAAGLTYECFCTRREILQAASAPHAPDGAYPGTCRNLSADEKAAKDRPPAIRLRSQVTQFTIVDQLHGLFRGQVDDFVLRRSDGVPAYNLAVVVDDGAQGVDQIVRGDDLLTSAPRQGYLAQLLGLTPATYVHVPLALNVEGKRLAKRDGAVTLRERPDAWALITASLGMPDVKNAEELLERWKPRLMPREPWVFDPSIV
ncbi:Glutamyl-Q tRNA(Asp) synthetase [Rhodococcus fascians]|uniref:tRNA glutamyl-Q(34) synthetase GluQRS n=1 Tax=Rhodococcoides fascians TaxID=1828 RepID=UPI001427CB21|nr:Glutamyl-Q tRNA(Asp) synthetase [Rhodococcus fascians]